MCQTLETLGEQENRVQIIFIQYWVRVQNIVPSKKYRKKTSKKNIYNEKKNREKEKKTPKLPLGNEWGTATVTETRGGNKEAKIRLRPRNTISLIHTCTWWDGCLPAPPKYET
jgi:hypothetical protein